MQHDNFIPFDTITDALQWVHDSLSAREFTVSELSENSFAIALHSGIIAVTMSNHAVSLWGRWDPRDSNVDYRHADHVANSWNQNFTSPYAYVGYDEGEPVTFCATTSVLHDGESRDAFIERIEQAIFTIDLYFSWIDHEIRHDETNTMSRNWDHERTEHDNIPMLHHICEVFRAHGMNMTFNEENSTLAFFAGDQSIPVILSTAPILNNQILVEAVSVNHADESNYDILTDLSLLITSQGGGVKATAIQAEDGACYLSIASLCSFSTQFTDDDIYDTTYHTVSRVVNMLEAMNTR